MTSAFDLRPIVLAVAGPNGAGKSTFHEAYLRPAGLRFVNADALARELALDPYDAARLAEDIRRELVRARESFVFETVFSDPAGDKLRFLRETLEAGYTVVLCFIGLAAAELSDQRVAMRVMQGGHDVPQEKIRARFPRSLQNLGRALQDLPHVLVFDNSDIGAPHRKVLEKRSGEVVFRAEPAPEWLPR